MRCGKNSLIRNAGDTSKSFLPVHSIAGALAEVWTREDTNERLRAIKDERDRQAIEESIEIKGDQYTVDIEPISYKDVLSICDGDYVEATSIWGDMYKNLPTIDRFTMQG